MDIQHSKFKRICVFCGSSPGKKTSYQDAAIQLGQELVCIILLLLLYYNVFSSYIFHILEFKLSIWILSEYSYKKKE